MVWGTMIVIAIGMMAFFYKRGWIQIADLRSLVGETEDQYPVPISIKTESADHRTRVLEHDQTPSVVPRRAA